MLKNSVCWIVALTVLAIAAGAVVPIIALVTLNKRRTQQSQFPGSINSHAPAVSAAL